MSYRFGDNNKESFFIIKAHISYIKTLSMNYISLDNKGRVQDQFLIISNLVFFFSKEATVKVTSNGAHSIAD